MSDKIFRCMICSAMDDNTMKLRKMAIEVMNHWNQINSESRHITFVPQGQGINTVPNTGKTAQAVIDEQSIKKSHFAIFIFNTSKGTVTSKAKTGTLDELNTFLKEKKKVHVYIKSSKELDDTKKEIQALKKVLYEPFKSQYELSTKIRDLLDYIANENNKEQKETESQIINNAQVSYTLKQEEYSNIYKIIKSSNGGITITKIKPQTGYSRQKIQFILKDMESKGIINKKQIMAPIEVEAGKTKASNNHKKLYQVNSYYIK